MLPWSQKKKQNFASLRQPITDHRQSITSSEARGLKDLRQPIASSKARGLRGLNQPTTTSGAWGLRNLRQPNSSSEAKGLRDLRQSIITSEARGLRDPCQSTNCMMDPLKINRKKPLSNILLQLLKNFIIEIENLRIFSPLHLQLGKSFEKSIFF